MKRSNKRRNREGIALVAASKDDAPCPLLEKLPPELRNSIYGHTFTSIAEPDGAIDLAAHSAPNKALLLTCRQIYAEAHKLHRTMHRTYWTQSNFHLQPSETDAFRRHKKMIHGEREEDLQHITNLVLYPPMLQASPDSPCPYRLHDVRNDSAPGSALTFRLMDARGAWSRESPEHPSEIFVLGVSSSGKIHPRRFREESFRPYLDARDQNPSMKRQIEYLLMYKAGMYRVQQPF